MTSTVYFIWAGRFLCVAVASRGGANRCELVCSRWRRAAHTPGAPDALHLPARHRTPRSARGMRPTVLAAYALGHTNPVAGRFQLPSAMVMLPLPRPMAPWLGLARVPLLVQRLRGHTVALDSHRACAPAGLALLAFAAGAATRLLADTSTAKGAAGVIRQARNQCTRYRKCRKCCK